MFDHFHEPLHNIDLVDGYGGLEGNDPAWQCDVSLQSIVEIKGVFVCSAMDERTC
jgi:hypothetical protein